MMLPGKELPAGVELRAIPGWDGYAAGTDGNIYSIQHGAPYRMYSCKVRGYIFVRLTRFGKEVTKRSHRLVLAAFHGPQPSPNHMTRHLNGDRGDNRPENLRWGTNQENVDDRESHGRTARGDRSGHRRMPHRYPRGEQKTQAKLNNAAVLEIKRLLRMGIAKRDIADRFTVARGTIRCIAIGRTWRHVPEPEQST